MNSIHLVFRAYEALTSREGCPRSQVSGSGLRRDSTAMIYNIKHIYVNDMRLQNLGINIQLVPKYAFI